MSEVVSIADEAALAAAVTEAAAGKTTLDVIGHGSKRGLGRPSGAARRLDVSGLAGISLYEPEELVLSAAAGTSLREIKALLAQNKQMLAFEPPDLGPLMGGAPDQGSIGGVFACNLAGPRRLSHGAVRDHALGARAVSGRGEVFKCGGRVVKNVTGYDLPRFLCGSFGTLAVLTEITLKVLPQPTTQETLLLILPEDETTARLMSGAMSAAMGSSCEVSGAAALPGEAMKRLGLNGFDQPVAAFRLEGFPPSVRARRGMLISVLAPFGGVEVLEGEVSARFWAAVRDVAPFVDTGSRAVWRLSTAPTQGPLLAEDLTRTLDAETFCDWGGGLVWVLMPGEAAQEAAVRAALAPHGGHATLVRAVDAQRTGAVFQPLDSAHAALSRRVKESFDPAGILNPGRMYAGM